MACVFLFSFWFCFCFSGIVFVKIVMILLLKSCFRQAEVDRTQSQLSGTGINCHRCIWGRTGTRDVGRSDPDCCQTQLMDSRICTSLLRGKETQLTAVLSLPHFSLTWAVCVGAGELCEIIKRKKKELKVALSTKVHKITYIQRKCNMSSQECPNSPENDYTFHTSIFIPNYISSPGKQSHIYTGSYVSYKSKYILSCCLR